MNIKLVINSVSFIILYFSIYSFFGWILETIYRSIKARKFVNAGFLYGPFVPVYGFGGVFIFLIDKFIIFFPIYVRLLLIAIIPTIIEYLAGTFLEKFYSIRLWDYSQLKFNIKGKICLIFSLIWAILSITNVYFLQKYIIYFINKIPENIVNNLSMLLFIYLVIDYILSSRVYYDFIKTWNTLKEIAISKIDIEASQIIIKDRVISNIRYFLRPMKKYPYLLNKFKKTSESVYNLITNKFHNYLNMKKKDKNKEKMDLFNTIINPIINKNEYQKLKEFNHHGTSIYEHNIKVAYLAYRIGKRLNLKLTDLVRGAMFHDLFFYDWRLKNEDRKELHGFSHPKESLLNAQKLFGELTDIEKDIILKHMWPLTLKFPLYYETWVVIISDKIIATIEVINEIINYFKLLLKGR